MDLEQIIAPLEVKVTNPEDMKSAPAARIRYRTTFRTVVMSASNNPVNIVDGPDPKLCYVLLEIKDATTILCESYAQANDAANFTAAQPNPVGMIIYAGQIVSRRIDTCGPIWAVTLAASLPNRIGICLVHETS
jgi:hypothetical protein